MATVTSQPSATLDKSMDKSMDKSSPSTSGPESEITSVDEIPKEGNTTNSDENQGKNDMCVSF